LSFQMNLRNPTFTSFAQTSTWQNELMQVPRLFLDRLFDNCIGQLDLSGLGVIKAGLERIAQGHQFIDLGDDAVLFGEGGNGRDVKFNAICGKIRLCRTIIKALN
jgi:hypothetical protein